MIYDDKQAVALARRLAEENGGTLPNGTWLLDHGYSCITTRIYSKPELFDKLIEGWRCRARTTDAEAVELAEKLAKTNGGKIPSPGWLHRNGRSGLGARIRNQPWLFSHLQQDHRQVMTDPECLALAHRLAKKNGDRIPTLSWLNRNGHGALAYRIKQKPELFRRLRRETGRGLTDDQMVDLAENLAKKNGGQIPAFTWLIQHNLKCLTVRMERRPKLFEHLARERRNMTDAEVVEEIETLAKRNGGTIPAGSVLRKMGKNHLAARIYNNPHLVAHLPQDRLNSKGKVI